MSKSPPERGRTRGHMATMQLEPADTFHKSRPPRVPSEALLGKHGELIILHAGREYRLRRTSLGKLMLTA